MDDQKLRQHQKSLSKHVIIFYCSHSSIKIIFIFIRQNYNESEYTWICNRKMKVKNIPEYDIDPECLNLFKWNPTFSLSHNIWNNKVFKSIRADHFNTHPFFFVYLLAIDCEMGSKLYFILMLMNIAIISNSVHEKTKKNLNEGY